jgi:poly(hydroxyalkanoate) depolymerase family esterase
MTIQSKLNLMEATRLTREGKLKEAMAILRGALAGEDRFPPAREDNGDGHQRQADDASPAPVIDLIPPSAATGNVWVAPPFSDGSSAAQNMRQPAPAMAAKLFDLLPKSGGAAGLAGLVGRAARPRPTPLPDGARFEDRGFSNEAGSRTYKLYVPSRYKGEALPLLVMLHGCTQTPDDFAAGTRMNALAEEHMFLVAYPAQAQSANASKCWNWFNAGDQQRQGGEPSLIAGITRQVMGDFPVEPGRVWVAGLSAGGAAAAIMGTVYPDLYAAIGVHSGLACGAAQDMPSAFAAMQQGGKSSARHTGRIAGRVVPTIVFHGDGDTTVTAVNGDQVIAQSKNGEKFATTISRGTAPGGASYTRTIHTDGNGLTVLEQWVLHGAGHAWSGGSSAGSFTDPRGPDASREMVRFFLQHPGSRPRVI